MGHPVDLHVGKRMRHRRWMLGITQPQLAERIGITFQQVQKYEAGMNRVSASRLWDIAEAMEVDVRFFFEGLKGAEGATSAEAAVSAENREEVELLRSYNAIPAEQRKRLFDLARALSGAA
jgi:transcriptional regulator with XRE-family HTH domain